MKTFRALCPTRQRARWGMLAELLERIRDILVRHALDIDLDAAVERGAVDHVGLVLRPVEAVAHGAQTATVDALGAKVVLDGVGASGSL